MKFPTKIYTFIPLILAGIFIWYFSSIFIYILIALVFSLLSAPIVELLDKIKIGKIKLPHTLNAGITLFLMMGITVGFFMIMIPILARQVNTLSELDTSSLESALKAPISSLEYSLKSYGLIDQTENLNEVVKQESQNIIGKFKFSDFFSDAFSFATSFLKAIFIIVFVSFFTLRDTRIFYRILLALVPENYHGEVNHIAKSTKRLLTRYFLGLILDITIVSSLYAIILSVLGVHNALLIGFLGGIVNVIPYIGPFIGVTIALFIGVISGLPMDYNTEIIPLVIKILSTFVFVNVLDAILMQPNIYAKSVNAHPLEIFFVIIIAGTFAGIPGMILAIPSYSFIRIVAREFFYKYPIVQKFTNSIGKD